MNVLKGIKTRALLIGALLVSFLISGCGVKTESDDRVMLQIGKNITEVNSAGQKKLLDKGGASYWQYDPDDKLLIASRTTVQIYSLETGAITNIGKDMLYDFKYEEQKMVGLNAWYENGKVYVYAMNLADDTLVVIGKDNKCIIS